MSWRQGKAENGSSRYEILFRGPAALNAIDVDRREDAGPQWQESDRAACDELVARRVASGESLIVNPDGTFPILDRLGHAEISPDGAKLRLVLGPTHYPAHLLTNVENPDWRQSRGPEVMADVLAVCALTVTADGLGLWGRRAPSIPEGRGRWHVLPAGHAEPPRTMAESLLSELLEELAVSRHEVEKAAWTGLIRDRLTGKPELTAFLRLSVGWDEIRHREAEDAWESSEILPLPWDAATVSRFLTEQEAQIVPSGHAAALLASLESFGPG